MEIRRDWLEKLIFGGEVSRRFTQDSPILPDVWIRYGVEFSRGDDPAIDLLLTPHSEHTAGRLYRIVQRRLSHERRSRSREQRAYWWATRFRMLGVPVPTDGRPQPQPPSVAYNQSSVVSGFYLDELIRVLLPLTRWWKDNVCRQNGVDATGDLKTDTGRCALASALERALGESGTRSSADLLWLVRLVGSILTAAEAPPLDRDADAGKAWLEIISPGNLPDLVERFRGFVLEPLEGDEMRAGDAVCDDTGSPCLHMVSLNREARPTITYSVQAVKADAARRVFSASCATLAWAIVDSGIDATHLAFRIRDEKARPKQEAFRKDGNRWINQTRVEATFDFTRIRHLLKGSTSSIEGEVQRITGEISVRSSELAAVNAALASAGEHAKAPLEAAAERLEALLAGLEAERSLWRQIGGSPDLAQNAKDLRSALKNGRAIDWDKIRQLIQVPHQQDQYRAPVHEHGTHVAGILGADWRRDDEVEGEAEPTGEDLIGVCPDIRLYDFRVFDDQGNGDEFSVLAALQFLRYLNAHRDLPLVHGANLSLSIRHDVANFACGRTPVCDECERVVNDGVIVVAAAGNYGYNRFSTLSETGLASTYEGYSNISITDPGNADAVITVGSTHRIEPHTYGVSYFSSRGPTGDGRYKPDLVAPGEKIRAPVPGNGMRVKDGTSMAAPHVSGAAALILARYREFIRRPRRVKEVLCASATDLGRDRYFQGAGMLDILRALQSV